MKGQLKVSTPAQYIAKLAEPRKTEVAAVDRLIRQGSGFKPFIQHGMLAYGRRRYKYTSGREAAWPLICLASNASYISLYVTGDDDIAKRYKKALPKANIGHCCVRFKHLDDLDRATLKRLIHEAAHASSTSSTE
jgi:hypothetical protein